MVGGLRVRRCDDGYEVGSECIEDMGIDGGEVERLEP